jgi:SAM-dependent methyltransferase
MAMPEGFLQKVSNSCTRVLGGLLSIPTNGPEISDRIVDFAPETLERLPVIKQELVNEFISLGNLRAARIVERLPALKDGPLDVEAMDQLLITVHCEMQRMSEEFQHGRRVSELLNPILQALREGKVDRPLRVVDIGCGSGFVVRWLTAHRALAGDVELVGADFNPALIAEARRLAAAENLSCRFVVGNAFRLEEAATVYLSTGVLHHFRGDELTNLFARHNNPQTCAFLHFDFHQSAMAPFGSWLFHVVRMRQPLARHDGVLSAVRAYTVNHLLSAARAGAPDFVSAVYGTHLWRLPIPRAFSSLVGMRPQYRDAFLANMGSKIASLGVVE